MGIMDRLLLIPFSLGIVAATVAVFGVVTNIIPEVYWQNELSFAIAQRETVFVVIVYFILSVYFFFRSFFFRTRGQRNSGEFAVINSAVGMIRVNLTAVKTLVERTANTVQGIHQVIAKPELNKTEIGEELNLKLELALSSEHNVKQVSEDVVVVVRSELSHVLGLNSVPVDIEITELSKIASTAKKRVV